MRKLCVLRPFFVLILVLLTAACSGGRVEPEIQLAIPTAIAPTTAEDTPPPTAAVSAATLPPPPTIQPSPEPTTAPVIISVTAVPPPTPHYRVAFVESDDTLNVRSGPGVQNAVVGELAPDASGAQITGAGQWVSGSMWFPIAADGLAGWVNGRFLTGSVESDVFCEDAAVGDLLAKLETAVANQDGALLAQLIHPDRGLRIRHAWWNPEVKITQTDAHQIFTSSASFDWGIQDGSGHSIIGPFSQDILPLLQEDLLLATETGCDEIIHGGTAGFVRLPDGYDAVHYYSLHRPGTDEFAGMNWGTWVVGIEQWQGEYYLSFLVHFQWEI